MCAYCTILEHDTGKPDTKKRIHTLSLHALIGLASHIRLLN